MIVWLLLSLQRLLSVQLKLKIDASGPCLAHRTVVATCEEFAILNLYKNFYEQIMKSNNFLYVIRHNEHYRSTNSLNSIFLSHSLLLNSFFSPFQFIFSFPSTLKIN